MQGCHWPPPQTRRYALDHSRLQCHHRSPLLKTQWSLSRLLGAQIRTQGRMIHHFLGVHPTERQRGELLNDRPDTEDGPHSSGPSVSKTEERLSALLYS